MGTQHCTDGSEIAARLNRLCCRRTQNVQQHGAYRSQDSQAVTSAHPSQLLAPRYCQGVGGLKEEVVAIDGGLGGTRHTYDDLKRTRM
jgi:hypothetical protein